MDSINTANLLERVKAARNRNCDLQETVGCGSSDGAGSLERLAEQIRDALTAARASNPSARVSRTGIDPAERARFERVDRSRIERDLEPVLDAIRRAQEAANAVHYSTDALAGALDSFNVRYRRELGRNVF